MSILRNKNNTNNGVNKITLQDTWILPSCFKKQTLSFLKLAKGIDQNIYK